MKSAFILIIIGILIISAYTPSAWAADEQAYRVEDLPVKGMVTMIDLGKKTCTQCKMMAPILDKLGKKYEGKAAIVFINLLDDPEQQYRFRLKALPTQIFFNPEGEEVFRHTGFMAEKAIVEQLAKMGVE
jgi:thioredoxin 1